MFFRWDIEMFDVQTNEPAKANTSDINEELGQVSIIYTDWFCPYMQIHNNHNIRPCFV